MYLKQPISDCAKTNRHQIDPDHRQRPIVIGQACEFDYSGTQACKVLREEGYRVILINSNPATIMTDPELADATYVEPITTEFVELILQKERPDAILPTMGGQTALNTAVALAEKGILEKYDVELIGAKVDAIRKAEDRQLFQKTMRAAGLRDAARAASCIVMRRRSRSRQHRVPHHHPPFIHVRRDRGRHCLQS